MAVPYIRARTTRRRNGKGKGGAICPSRRPARSHPGHNRMSVTPAKETRARRVVVPLEERPTLNARSGRPGAYCRHPGIGAPSRFATESLDAFECLTTKVVEPRVHRGETRRSIFPLALQRARSRVQSIFPAFAGMTVWSSNAHGRREMRASSPACYPSAITSAIRSLRLNLPIIVLGSVSRTTTESTRSCLPSCGLSHAASSSPVAAAPSASVT